MNILEAIDAALPEMPAKSMRRTYPKLDPQVISKEHIEHGVPTVLAKMPGSDSFVRLTPEQWKLLELFDGERTYKDVAGLTEETTGNRIYGRRRQGVLVVPAGPDGPLLPDAAGKEHYPETEDWSGPRQAQTLWLF